MKLVRKKNPVIEDSVRSADREDFEAISIGGISFDSLFSRAKVINWCSSDYTVRNVSSDNFRFLCENGINEIKYEYEKGTNRVSNISSFALSQLCNKVGVPNQYIKRCIDTERFNLVEENFNSWIDTYEKDLFIREYKSEIRGILTPRYSIFDTHEILEVVGDCFPVEEYSIKGYFLSPERFHVRFVSPEPLDVPNEDLFPGITIDSSDVGRSHLRVNFFIWKQVCTNGLIVPKTFGSLYTKRHIGIDSNDFREELTHSLDSVEPLIAEVTESIKNTATVSISYIFEDGNSIEKLIKDLMNETGMKENSAKEVIQFIQEEKYPMNKWGLINAITDVAQDYTLEKRIDIEQIAGNLLVA